MITNIHTNRMGTVSFNGKFGKMRKEQDFVVYPMSGDSDGKTITIQSEHRFGYVRIETGKFVLSANHAQYANSQKLAMDMANLKAEAGQIPSDELEALKTAIRGTAGAMVGNNGMRVFCDNSNANLV